MNQHTEITNITDVIFAQPPRDRIGEAGMLLHSLPEYEMR